MTLSEWIEQNRIIFKRYANSWLDDYSRRAGELAAHNADRGGSGELTQTDREYLDANFDINDKAGDVAKRVLQAFHDNTRDQPFKPFTAQDIETMATLFPPSWNKATKDGMYDMAQQVMDRWESSGKTVPLDSTFLTNLLDHARFVDRWTIGKLKETKNPEPIIEHILKLKKGDKKTKALNEIMDNPFVKNKQAADVLHQVANEVIPAYDQTIYAIERKLGYDAFNAELDKLPPTAPIFYKNSISSDMSRRSAEDIERHIKGAEELANAHGGPDHFDALLQYTPMVNGTVIQSPNFLPSHLQMWPKHEEINEDDIKRVIDNPRLAATMKHDELAQLVQGLTGDGDFSHANPRRIYSHMVDLSDTGGRPVGVDYKDDYRWFRGLSRNPTFIADTDDLSSIADQNHYSMFGPEKMTPRLKEYFEKIKPILNDLSKSPYEEDVLRRFSDSMREAGQGGVDPYSWRHLMPIMSHYDPQYTKEWMNNASDESFKYITESLAGNPNADKIHTSVLNGMNTDRLYSFTQEHRIPLSKLNEESQKRMAEHFKGTIPQMDDDDFGHFHESTGNDNAFVAGEFGALDEYLAHAAKGVKHQFLQVKRGSGTLRALRDFLEQAYRERGVSSINPRDLPKDKTWNSVYQTLVTKNKDGSTTESKTIDWNPLRGKDGNVSMETVQSYIDQMKPIGVNVTESYWSGGQRHNHKNSKVVVFGMTNDHIQKLKNAGLWEDFKSVSSKLPRGHPQHPFALGWVRYTLPNMNNSHDGHVFIDEVQNDIAKQLGGNTEITDANKKKIMDILYDGSHPSDLLHEAFHEFARSKKWHDRPFTIHSPESKKPISLADQSAPVPVHYKKTYEEIVKQRFHVEPSTYGERPDETHTGIQGKPVWTGTIRKMEEELEKMALADVKGTAKKDHFDYSHLLPDHLKGAYTIKVIYSPATPEYDNKPRIIAQAITNKREFAGSVSGFISGNRIETHQGVKPAHQQKGLGSALLESVLAHAYNAHGVTGVHPAEHTEGATGTHRRVSSKHDLGFESSPTKADKYGQWYEHKGYILKNDDDSDWE